ncbi:XapX domain-containing protein [Streptomyces sp. NPDC055287]
MLLTGALVGALCAALRVNTPASPLVPLFGLFGLFNLFNLFGMILGHTAPKAL